MQRTIIKVVKVKPTMIKSCETGGMVMTYIGGRREPSVPRSRLATRQTWEGWRLSPWIMYAAVPRATDPLGNS